MTIEMSMIDEEKLGEERKVGEPLFSTTKPKASQAREIFSPWESVLKSCQSE